MRRVSARPRVNTPIVRALAAAALLAALAGCHHRKAVKGTETQTTSTKLISDIDLKSYKPNEAGAVMIVMYHRFESKDKNGDMNRTPDTFRKDLDDLYKRGYRPVTVSEFVQDKMDVPAGKTPICLTFDDSWDSQFKIVTGSDGQPHIDPNCAVGIMETFSKSHPDWPTKATFFVLPKEGKNGDPFGQPEYVSDKFDYLVNHGYEIGNHTSTHSSMRGMAADRVQWELGTAVRDIKAINPKAQMQIAALPYGQFPTKAARPYTISGTGSGTHYSNIAVLNAAWRPVMSPITKNDKKVTELGKYAAFDPNNIERIKPNPAQANMPGTLEYYLKFFDANPTKRYISGGNKNVIAVPKAYESMVDKARVAKTGKTLQLYSFTASTGAGGGQGLSVQ